MKALVRGGFSNAVRKAAASSRPAPRRRRSPSAAAAVVVSAVAEVAVAGGIVREGQSYDPP
jgi:hypothetical protein